uniref:CHM n=1 Tax=Bursaphelenchus xylophilus TaxID=6326 RepID=A0A1I7SSP4_BURXY
MMLNQDLASSNESSPQMNQAHDNSDGRSGLSSDSDAEDELFDKDANSTAVVPNGLNGFAKSEEETNRKVPLVKYLSEEEKPSSSDPDDQRPSTSQEEPQSHKDSETEPHVQEGESEEDNAQEPPSKQRKLELQHGTSTSTQRVTRSRTRQTTNNNNPNPDQPAGPSS